MKILQVLYYYYPHVSGLTIYVERLGRHLAARGHDVTVLASQHDSSFPRNESVDGVEIVRVGVSGRASRGIVMPNFLPTAARLINEHDVVHMHMPMAESAALAAIAKAMRKRVVVTHHTDLTMTVGTANRIAGQVVYGSGVLAGKLSDAVVTYTHDRASVSPFIKHVRDKTRVIYPPIEQPPVRPGGAQAFRQEHQLGDAPLIGFAGRFAEEKGIAQLLETIPITREALPGVKYLFAGEYENVVGETLFQRTEGLRNRYSENIVMLGVLRDQELVDFYSALDVLVLPSTNYTETFGLVQIEAMLTGTPVVASDLPGVREPVLVTGMGKISPPGDSEALAAALIEVVKNRQMYVRPTQEIADRFRIEATVDAYERVYGATN